MFGGLFYCPNFFRTGYKGAFNMHLWGIAICIVGTLLFYALLNYAQKNKHPLKRAGASMLWGAAALFAVNLSSGITGVTLPISVLSILISLMGGVPGVTLMLGLNLFF